MSGTLFLVATPIGNLEDMTFRAVRVLREVSLIAAEDTRRTARLLQHYSIPTPTTSLHEHNEGARTPGLISRLLAGDSIALVSDAGTPVVSDPGARLVAAAHGQSIRVEPIPGPSSERLSLYLRSDELHQAFQFDLLRAPFDARIMKAVITTSLHDTERVGASCTWTLSNHDVARQVTRYARSQPPALVDGPWDRSRHCRPALTPNRHCPGGTA